LVWGLFRAHVADNGIGIKPDSLTKIFDISQPHATINLAAEKGSGLGLLLCKEFVEKHGGKIWAGSEVGKGSDFKFTIPIFTEQANGINNWWISRKIVTLEICPSSFRYTFISKQFSIKDNTLSKNQKIISSSKNTPEVILDPNGIIKITGRLISENPIDFFNQLDELINEYFCNPAVITCFEINLEYLNSEGTKHLLDTIHRIIHIHLKNNRKKIIINWYYRDDDEDMLEKGTFFSSVLNVYISLIKIIR
jgi:SiaC family regulatory phosphoprotein/Histidine kinase-, DNA gyrase B-, and HSP90-like ATPase